MATTMGLVLIDGIGLGDLAEVGFFPTDAQAPGHEILLLPDPAAAEVAGGVLIAQGQTDITQEIESEAITFGSRIVAVGIDTRDSTYLLTVYEDGALVRHVVDTLEDRPFDVGAPLEAEHDLGRLTEHTTLEIFERLTGLSLAEVQDTIFTPLRPAQETDELTGRPWFMRLLGLYSNRDGYADKTGPPVPDSRPDA